MAQPIKLGKGLALTVLSLFCLAAAIFYYIKGRSPPSIESDILRLGKNFRVSADFLPTDSVIVSDTLFEEEFPARNLAADILEAGANLIFLTSTNLTPQTEIEWLQKNGLGTVPENRLSFIPVSHDSYWVRDFGGQFIFSKFPETPRALKIVDFPFRDESYLNDTVPYQIGLFLKLGVEHIPLTLEGGNFIFDGSTCFLTDESVFSKDLTESEREELPGKINSYLKEFLGCNNVVIVDKAPYNHIDMWAKPVGKGIVLVNSIDKQALQELEKQEPRQYPKIKEMQQSLDRAAAILAQHTKVERVPMPIPNSSIFPSYTNSTLVNGVALVPRYKSTGTLEDYVDAAHFARYEAEVEKAYQKHGYKVKFLNADHLITNGGAIHCVTVDIPKN
ncbi:MAG: agmatine deiminase family protein [Oligoflexales bacterium]